jgi:membrane associated rhomboid family serine protease
MFPLSDENPHFLTPYTTYLLIALNIAAWVLIQGMGMEPRLGASLCTLGLVPGELLQTLAPGTSFALGRDTACVLTDTPNWLTLVSHMFLHGGWLHIIGNMWFLWIFGNNVEDSMGHVRFFVFYLLCGFAAAAVQMLSDPAAGMPMVGASGAIGGVMGAYVLLYPRVRVKMLLFLGFYITTFTIPAIWMLGYWFLAQVIGGVGAIGAQGGGVAFWAHVGGFVAGAALILLFQNPELVRAHPHRGWRAPA